MKTKLLLFIIISFLMVSCESENHYHDGHYEGGISFIDVTWKISGNEILINNSITGTSKLSCKQYPDRIEYKEKDGTTKILYAQKNGDLKMSDLVIFKKVKTQNKEEIAIESIENQTKNFDLSKDSYENESAIIKNIINAENGVYIVVDVVQIKYSENPDDDDYKVINENPKLRTYKVIPNVLIKDSQCMESTTSNYLSHNKDRIKTVSPFGFVLITTNNKGELTKLNLGCWN